MKKYKQAFEKLKSAMLDAIYPPRCTGCGALIISGALCNKCKKALLPLASPVCHKCGTSLKDHDTTVCSAISAEVIAAYYYGGIVRKMILELKENPRNNILDEFFDSLCDKISTEYAAVSFDATVCVPSFDKTKYNSSAKIAECLAEAYMLDFDRDTLTKYRKTQKQHYLSQNERERNLKNSIAVTSGKEDTVKGKTLLLCDDVKSTGATLNECVKALYCAGAKSVYCVCIAVSDYVCNS